MDTIKEKSVLITGAGRGIGKRLAMGFAQAGARVGLLARSQAELDLAKLEIEQAGGKALRIRADVRDLEQMTPQWNACATTSGAGRADRRRRRAGPHRPVRSPPSRRRGTKPSKSI